MIDENEQYKIVISDKVEDFEDVFFLVNQLEFIKSDALKTSINLKYANEKLTFFCKYLDTARAIAQTLSDCGFKSTYHFTQEITLPKAAEKHISIGSNGNINLGYHTKGE